MQQLTSSTGIQFRGHSCDVCGKRFYQKTDHRRHMRTHTGEKPYKCDVCLKYFSRKGNMEAHRRLHMIR